MSPSTLAWPHWIFYVSGRWCWKATLHLLGGIQITGLEHVPYRGPVILAPNHVSLLDPWIMCAAVPNPLRSLAAEYLFRIPGLRQYLYAMGAFPLRQGESDLQALGRARSYLSRGATVMIFPEGGCSQNGEPQPWRPGVALLSIRAQAPVIPVVIRGSNGCLPLGSYRPRYNRMSVEFLPALRPPQPSASNRQNLIKVYLRQLEEAWQRGAARQGKSIPQGTTPDA